MADENDDAMKPMGDDEEKKDGTGEGSDSEDSGM